jgi:peptidoglycan glycosyltransferase
LPLSTTFIQNANRSTCGPGAEVTLADALRISCNIPFAQIGATLGEDLIAEYAEAFGYGKRIKVPMDRIRQLLPEGHGRTPVDAVVVRPVRRSGDTAADRDDDGRGRQRRSGHAADAHREHHRPDLTVIEPFQEEVYSEPISAADRGDTLAALMVNNVSNGAASSARISGVNVGGKTGTAQNSRRCSNTLWFTGFAPAEDPQIAIAVVVETNRVSATALPRRSRRRVIEAVLSK